MEGALAGATWKDELVAVPFWANTQLLWYRKSVAEAAGLDLDASPVTWDQIIEAAEARGSDHRRPGHPGRVADRLDQRPDRRRRRPDHREPGGAGRPGRAGADLRCRTRGREGDRGRGELQLRASGFHDGQRGLVDAVVPGEDAGFQVNWPFVWPASKAAVEEGAYDQAALDDWGWALYPATVEGEDPAPPLGGIDIGVSAVSENVDLPFEAARCIVSEENQKLYFITNGNPAAKAAVFDDPEVQEAFPMADVLRESLELAAPRPSDRLLQRGLHRAPEDLAPAVVRRPGDHAGGRDRPDHRRAERGEAAVTSTTTPAAAEAAAPAKPKTTARIRPQPRRRPSSAGCSRVRPSS